MSVSLELNYIKMSKSLTYEDLVSPISLCSFLVLRQVQRAFRDFVEHDESVDDHKLVVSCRFVASGCVD